MFPNRSNDLEDMNTFTCFGAALFGFLICVAFTILLPVFIVADIVRLMVGDKRGHKC